MPLPQAESSMTKNSMAAITLGGMEVVYIVAIITLGVVCLYALYKDYDVTGSSPYGDLKVKIGHLPLRNARQRCPISCCNM